MSGAGISSFAIHLSKKTKALRRPIETP